MKISEMTDAYASLLIHRGVNIKPGQRLLLNLPAEACDLAAAIVRRAYERGSGEVTVMFESSETSRARMFYAPESVWREVDASASAVYRLCAESGAALLKLNAPDLETFRDVPAERLWAKSVAERRLRRTYREMAPYEVQACLASAPVQSWAAAVFPELSPKEAYVALWESVIRCTKCDQPDPVAAWDLFFDLSAKRANRLNDKQYIKLRYKSGVTDLEVGLLNGHIWSFGGVKLADGTVFMPNLPTEEIAGVPHKYRINGRVGSTMPLNHQGRIVEDIRLDLENGRIVGFSARKGEDALAAVIDTDEGSHYIGEIAFVDQRSPIGREKRIFYNTLYDENASCHMAIGMCAYNAAKGIEGLSVQGLDALGINSSAIHVDFMIGSDDLDITGVLPDGTEEPVFIQGQWADNF
ncbi:MAG: aminopeptidase [Clostridiales bacterium]|jgi:aminopeptidase|nr:aminopeptidase [Clostridiales bacterium]